MLKRVMLRRCVGPSITLSPEGHAFHVKARRAETVGGMAGARLTLTLVLLVGQEKIRKLLLLRLGHELVVLLGSG